MICAARFNVAPSILPGFCHCGVSPSNPTYCTFDQYPNISPKFAGILVVVVVLTVVVGDVEAVDVVVVDEQISDVPVKELGPGLPVLPEPSFC